VTYALVAARMRLAVYAMRTKAYHCEIYAVSRAATMQNPGTSLRNALKCATKRFY